MGSALGTVISADSHVTEPGDLWDRYVAKEFRGRAPHIEHGDKFDRLMCDGEELCPVGMLHGIRYSRYDAMVREGRYADIPANGWDLTARLADVEPDGVVAELLYPTVGLLLYGLEDRRLAHACMVAYNSWIADFCRERPDRVKAVAMISL